MKYFAKIRFLGTDFCGFQVQPNARTVQGVLCSACEQAFGAPAKVTGCSRTDSGVHANEFCLTIETEGAKIPADKLPMALSRYLPHDISLLYAEECSDDFHPRYSVKYKEYLYKIRNQRINDPFEYGRAWLLSQHIDDEALKKMRAAATLIVGRHDFASFMSEGSDVRDTVREVYSLTVERINDSIDIKISADGFLYNMVRIIVGTLVEVAFGRILPENISKIIESCDRSLAGMTAPPEGLYLNRVVY